MTPTVRWSPFGNSQPYDPGAPVPQSMCRWSCQRPAWAPASSSTSRPRSTCAARTPTWRATRLALPSAPTAKRARRVPARVPMRTQPLPGSSPGSSSTAGDGDALPHDGPGALGVAEQRLVELRAIDHRDHGLAGPPGRGAPQADRERRPGDVLAGRQREIRREGCQRGAEQPPAAGLVAGEDGTVDDQRAGARPHGGEGGAAPRGAGADDDDVPDLVVARHARSVEVSTLRAHPRLHCSASARPTAPKPSRSRVTQPRRSTGPRRGRSAVGGR